MTSPPRAAHLASRALIAITGPDWRSYLQSLITQDVECLAAGSLAFGALLTPQGRLLFDLFVAAADEGCRLDCAAPHRDALIERLALYRLRAKVEIARDETPVWALWGGASAPRGWWPDPRLPGLGFRAFGIDPPAEANAAGEVDYDRFRLDLGVPGPDDWGFDRTYPIEANFDLLGGIDFQKGCFVGQETTSRMKRRADLKSRMGPILFEGPAPAFGSELLAGELRAGQALTGAPGRAMALLRLDRMDLGPRVLADGRAWRPDLPAWISGGAIRP